MKEAETLDTEHFHTQTSQPFNFPLIMYFTMHTRTTCLVLYLCMHESLLWEALHHGSLPFKLELLLEAAAAVL